MSATDLFGEQINEECILPGVSEDQKTKKKRKKNGKSPTVRTLEELRRKGAIAGIVERFIKAPGKAGGGFRSDLFGAIDIIAIRNRRIIGIQCSTATNRAAHIKKIMADPETRSALWHWMDAGGEIELWSWKKDSKGKWSVVIDPLENSK